MTDPTLKPATTQAEQLSQIASGCQFVLGWGGIIALGGLVFWAAGLPLDAAARPGEDVIVFLYAKSAQNAVFWCLLVGTLSFFLMLAAAKTTRGFVTVLAIFLALAALGVWWLYGSVAAIAFHENAIDLRFVWPRPAVRLIPGEIISVEHEERPASSENAVTEYVLHLRTQRGHYASFADTNLEDMLQTRRRIEAMQGKPRRAPPEKAGR